MNQNRRGAFDLGQIGRLAPVFGVVWRTRPARGECSSVQNNAVRQGFVNHESGL